MTDMEGADLVGMIRESAGAIAPRDGTLERVRRLRFEPPGFDRGTWREMAELGWIGLRLPEETGGVGLGMAAAVALHEELGRGLVPEPLLAASLSAALLAEAGENERLASLLTGEALVATAWAGEDDAFAATGIGRSERRFVVAAEGATDFIVPSADGSGVTARLVPAAEVQLETFGLQDGGFASTVHVPADAGRVMGDDLTRAFARALDEAALGMAAYLLGVSERAFEITVDYLGQRKQFGQALGSFQALQHRCADIRIQITLARASVEGAAADLDAGAGDGERAAAVSRAKARASDLAMLMAREAIQMHGAIGYTDEYDVGLYVRKAMVLANAYGSASLHRRRFMSIADDLAA